MNLEISCMGVSVIQAMNSQLVIRKIHTQLVSDLLSNLLRLNYESGIHKHEASSEVCKSSQKLIKHDVS